MKTYNGHRSWNAWNVSLWIGNDENLYRFAMDCIETSKALKFAAAKFLQCYGDTRTPDGAAYNRISVKLALEGLMKD